MSYLIRTVPGLEPARRLIIKGGEIDLLVRNYRPFVEPLRWLEDYFLVECKDQSRRVNEKEFGHFLTKLNLSKTRQGIIVSRLGLTGSGGFAYASRDQKLAFSEMDVVVLSITIEEVARLAGVGEFLMLLQRKYEELRFGTRR
jgi:hypothetical protein